MAMQASEEILHELLDAVVHYSEWDIAMKARSLKGAGPVSSLVELVVSGPQFDLCSLIRATVPSRILSNYSLRCGTEILQLKCVDQKASGYCGHYALHFALCGLELCRSTTQASVLGYVEELERTGPFWRRYWLSLEELMYNVRRLGEDSWWPWTRDGVMQGDMERSYMWYLVMEDSHSKRLGGAKLINVLQYAYGQFHSNVASICELQDKIDMFCTSTHSIHMAMILGVTNHWLTVLAYKVPATGQVGVLYLDSNNTPILRASDEELNRILASKEQEKMKKRGEGYTTWQRTIKLQAWKDQRHLLDVLSDCLSGRHNLRTELLDSTWRSLLDSYYSNVCTHGARSGHHTICLLQLVQWLQVERRPKAIREVQLSFLHQVGGHWLSPTVHTRIMTWVEDIHQVSQCTCGIEEINELLKIIDELVESLLTEPVKSPSSHMH